MSIIRVGYFEDFKGADTLLLAVDAAGLTQLLQWVGSLAAAAEAQPLGQCPGAVLHRGVHVVAEVTRIDSGLVRRADGALVWGRSPEGWGGVADKLAGLRSSPTGHQYLEGPADDIVPIVSIGQYGDEWWVERAG